MPLHFVAGWSTSHFLEAGLGPAGKEECDIVIFYESGPGWSPVLMEPGSACQWRWSGAGGFKGPESVGEVDHRFHTLLIFLQAYAKYSVCVCVCVCVCVVGEWMQNTR